MKKKVLFSIIALLFFAIIGGGSFDNDTLLFITIILVVFIIVSSIVFQKDNKKQEELFKKIEIEKQAKKDRYYAKLKELESSHGKADRTIHINEYDINGDINVYESKSIIRILGIDYKFSDILDCTLTDKQINLDGGSIAETTTSTSSAVGRAIVGDIIAGPAGAIIGGSTAKKKTVIKEGSIMHIYIVGINVNSISKPLIEINTSNNMKLANDIVSLMNVIIHRSQQ